MIPNKHYQDAFNFIKTLPPSEQENILHLFKMMCQWDDSKSESFGPFGEEVYLFLMEATKNT